MLCSKKYYCFLVLVVFFASFPFVNSDVLLDDGNPDEGPRKQMEFAKNTDMLPLYLQMNNVSINSTTGNIEVSLSKSQDQITLPLITKSAPKLSFSVSRSEDCLDDSDCQTWEFAAVNGPKCALFMNWNKYMFSVTTSGVDGVHEAGTFSTRIYSHNVCVAKEGIVTVVNEKGSSGNFTSANCKLPPSVCTLDCPMNFTIGNVNSTGDCDLFLQFNGSEYMLESAPLTPPSAVSTTSPDDSILGTEQTNGVKLGGLETWKLGLIIGVCILLFLLLVGALACFLIHRYCPDDPETEENEAGKNGPTKVVPTGRKPIGSKPRGERNLSNEADGNKPN